MYYKHERSALDPPIADLRQTNAVAKSLSEQEDDTLHNEGVLRA
jgi:hypothetical protein